MRSNQIRTTAGSAINLKEIAIQIAAVALILFSAAAYANNLVIEGLKHNDSLLHSYTVAAKSRTTLYHNRAFNQPPVSLLPKAAPGPLSKPSLKEAWGRFTAVGSLKCVTRKTAGPRDSADKLPWWTTDTYVFDGEKIIEEKLYENGLRSMGKEYHIWSVAGFDPFKSEQFDPRYWMGYFGTPLGDFLTNGSARGVSIQEVVIDGERCYHIRAQDADATLEFIVNGERGFRPQRMMHRRRWFVVIEMRLEHAGDGVWHPSEVNMTNYEGMSKDTPIVSETQIVFSRFEANIDIPERERIVLPDEYDFVRDHRVSR